MSPEQYRAIKEVADLLQVNEVIVRRRIKDGELRAIDIGKGWWIGTNDLDAFLEGHATRPAAKLNGGTDTSTEDTSVQKTMGQKN